MKVGDEIETYIIRVNDVEGYAMLSKKRLDAVKVWEDIAEACENKTTLKRARSPRRTRAASSSTSRACVCSFPPLRAVSPVVLI